MRQNPGQPALARLHRGSQTRPDRDLGLSPQLMSDLIGAIYDCVIGPENWAPTLDAIRQELSFANSALAVTPLRPGAHVVHVSTGIDEEWLHRLSDYSMDIAALWGGPQRMQDYPLDEPIVQSETPGYQGRESNRYFQDFLAPRSIVDAAAITIAREPSLVGYVSFGRHAAAGPIGERELSVLRLLGPHFRRAVTISNLFDLKAIEAATFGSALDGFAFGVVLVDERLGIVHANRAAEAMLAEGDPIHSTGGMVTLPIKRSQDALEAAVRQAARDEVALGQRGIGIPAVSGNGEPAVIHVLPLHRRTLRAGLVQLAVAALFVVPSQNNSGMPTDALALLYDLTPAEARVFELVCAGRTQDEIAYQLGIARSTVKTHLVHVFEKTGCKRQVDLLKLAARVSLPIRG